MSFGLCGHSRVGKKSFAEVLLFLIVTLKLKDAKYNGWNF